MGRESTERGVQPICGNLGRSLSDSLASTQRTVAVLATATFLSGMGVRICDGLIPRIASDFQVSFGQAGLTVTVFATAYAVLQLAFGPLGDRIGKAPVVFAAVCGSAVFALVSAFAGSFAQLLAWRAVWGMAAAGVVPLAMAWIGDSVELEDRQPMLARLLLGTLSGMTLDTLAGGLFADAGIGWRGAFASIAAAYVLVLVVMFQRFQAMGWRTATAPSTVAPHKQWLEVLRNRWSWVVLGGAAAEGMLLFGPVAFMPTVVHHRWNWSLTASSALLSLFAVGGVVYAIAARTIVRRLGQVRMARTGGWIMGIGYLGWLLTPWPWLTGPIALAVGFGAYLYHNTLQTHATQMAPSARATAMTMFAFMLFLSQAIGAALAGFAFDHLGLAWMLLPPAVLLPLAGLGFARALTKRAQA